MDFIAVVDQVIALLRQRGRMTYSTLYAALAMQAALRHSSDEGRRTHGLAVHCRMGLNAGAVVVRAIRNCRWAASSGRRAVSRGET
jgi:hypothetical protein